MVTVATISDLDKIIEDKTGPRLMQEWKWLPAEKLSDNKQKKLCYQLNCMGSLYYFIVLALERRRLNTKLHLKLCRSIEKFHVRDVIEVPRDHFKTTIFSEGAPMWWALNFTQEHEYAMRGLGYGDEYIRWMKRAHDRDTTTLVVSEIIDNAIKIGARIQKHYLDGEWFRWLFPDSLPDSSCVWNAKSMSHKRSRKSVDGEGTYDFMGVGSALQSRHYKRIIQDDLFGRDAAFSEAIASDTIDYHTKLAGAFDSTDSIELNDELVVGNRWAYYDLNHWIREHESELGYCFQTHDAEGGCCPEHPAGQPIFPEEWSLEKLAKTRIKFGAYDYSCQYRNNPIPEGQQEFQTNWLRYYDFAYMSETDLRAKIVHSVYNGCVYPDIMPGEMQIELLSDPAHADREVTKEDKLRCRHAIMVVGYQGPTVIKGVSLPQRIYILDAWAKACRYHEYINQIYEFVKKWKLRRIWLETVAAQKYLKLYLDEKSKATGINLKIEELKTDNSPGAKFKRIRAMNTYYEECQVWLRQAHNEFVDEYKIFPWGKTIDLLDIFGYAPQVLRGGATRSEVREILARKQEEFNSGRNSITGY